MEVDIESKQQIVKKNKKEEYLERLAKYKEQKAGQKNLKQPLKEKSGNVSNQKRKLDDIHASKDLKVTSIKRNNGLQSKESKPLVNRITTNISDQNSKPKNTVSSHTSATKPDNVQKSSTPMGIRLQRWKAQKNTKENELKRDRKLGAQIKKSGNKESRNVQQTSTGPDRDKYSLGGTQRVPNLEKFKSNRTSLPSGYLTKKIEQNNQKHSNQQLTVSSKLKSSLAGKNIPRLTKPTSNLTNQIPAVNKYQTSLRSPAKPTETSKSNLKRRHSEVNIVESPRKKRKSILKRKSCIASFSDDMTDKCYEEAHKSSGSGDHESITNSKQQAVDDDVFVQNGKTPDLGRSVRFMSPNNGNAESEPSAKYRKTPKTKLTQASMRAKLDGWLKTKGKTPSKFRHLMCFDAHLSAKKCKQSKRSLTVDELTEQQEAMEREDIVKNLASEFDQSSEDEQTETNTLTSDLDTMLTECSTLFEAGLPVEDTLKWIESIEKNIPIAKHSARFYICKATVLQSTTDLEKVLEVFEAAVINGAKPSDELAKALTHIVKEISAERERQATKQPKYLEKEIQKENIFESSSIKYCVTQVTPFSKRKRKSTSDVEQTSTSPCAVVTPVRRSTRRSLASLPESLHDKKQIYNSLEDINDIDKKKSLFLPNAALISLLDDSVE